MDSNIPITEEPIIETMDADARRFNADACSNNARLKTDAKVKA